MYYFDGLHFVISILPLQKSNITVDDDFLRKTSYYRHFRIKSTTIPLSRIQQFWLGHFENRNQSYTLIPIVGSCLVWHESNYFFIWLVHYMFRKHVIVRKDSFVGFPKKNFIFNIDRSSGAYTMKMIILKII